MSKNTREWLLVSNFVGLPSSTTGELTHIFQMGQPTSSQQWGLRKNIMLLVALNKVSNKNIRQTPMIMLIMVDQLVYWLYKCARANGNKLIGINNQ